MNENWPEIVETLLPYFGVNSAEGDYQREIEICLKFLGWKKTNETMRSQLTLPIGNNSSIRPDIVLWKKNANGVPTPVLPIVNPEKPDMPLNKNDAFQKLQKRRVQEKR